MEEEYINMPPLKKVNLNTQPLEKINLNMPPFKKVNLNTQPLEKVNIKDLEKTIKKNDFHEYELNISDSRIKYFDKIIKGNPKMSDKKIDILNQLKSLYEFRKNYFEVKINNPKTKTPNLRKLDDEIRKLEDEFREQKGSGTFTYQNKFVKLLTLLTQLLAKNTARNCRKLKDDINQMLKELYNSKQITKQVYNMLNKSITSK